MGSYVSDFDFTGIRVEAEVDAATSAEAGVPFKYLRRAEPCHSRRPPPCHPRWPLSVIPAGPSLSFPLAPLCHSRWPLPVIPAVFSGNPVKTVLLQESIREAYPFGKAGMTAEWQAPWCRTVNEGNIQPGKTLDSRLQMSGMTGGVSGMTGEVSGMTEGVRFIWERGMLMTRLRKTVRQKAFSTKWT